MSSQAPDEPPALRVEGLTAGYGGPPIVENVNVQARPGAITAIVGPNAADKSTLPKAIAGLIRPTGCSSRIPTLPGSQPRGSSAKDWPKSPRWPTSSPT